MSTNSTTLPELQRQIEEWRYLAIYYVPSSSLLDALQSALDLLEAEQKRGQRMREALYKCAEYANNANKEVADSMVPFVHIAQIGLTINHALADKPQQAQKEG